jgi:hypothetical protein
VEGRSAWVLLYSVVAGAMTRCYAPGPQAVVR